MGSKTSGAARVFNSFQMFQSFKTLNYAESI